MKTSLCFLGVLAMTLACESRAAATDTSPSATRVTAAATAPATGKQAAPVQPAKPAPKPGGERERVRRPRPEYLFL